MPKYNTIPNDKIQELITLQASIIQQIKAKYDIDEEQYNNHLLPNIQD